MAENKKPSPVVMVAAQLIAFASLFVIKRFMPEAENEVVQQLGKAVESAFYEIWGTVAGVIGAFQLAHVTSKNIARNMEAKKK